MGRGGAYDGGRDLLLREGAGALVRALARGITVRTETPVRAVEHGSDAVTVVTARGGRLAADGCVVTVPLGVLQAGGVRFDPPLAAPARRAIDRLGFGLLDKVLLRYDAAWWPGGVTQLGTVGTGVDRTMSAFDLRPLTGLPILAAFVGGAHARALERRGPRAAEAAVTERLAAGFGDAALRPRRVQVTRWGADRWARGAYSYLRPGASSADREALGARAGRLVLAGEHTSPDRPATMDGALAAGRQAGREMAGAVGA